MFNGLNKVLIIGTLNSDPDIKYVFSKNFVVVIYVNTIDFLQTENEEKGSFKTNLHKIVLHSGLAEMALNFLKKGSKVYIEGFLKSSRWKDRNEKFRYNTEIQAINILSLDSEDTDSNENTTLDSSESDLEINN